MNTLREHFLLDPDVIYLNHGGFGACPRPVFARYQDWQRALERQPTEFLSRRAPALLAEARAALAAYVGTDAGSLIFVTNATYGVNVAAHSLALAPGDEVLATDQEYGAVDRTWEAVCQRREARYIRQPVRFPLTSAGAFVDALWAGVTPRTRIISLSHITSPSALIFPIAEVCRRARQAGILTVIDGAHAVGQIPLDLDALGADFYAGNCHKWLCAPKGAAFLYARPEVQHMIRPLVVSWDMEDPSDFVARNQWQGTRDLAPFLAVPDAIAFQAAHDWDRVRADCHALACETLARVCAWSGREPLAPSAWFAQMVTLPLPRYDGDDLRERLYEEHRIEAPVIWTGERSAVRVSVQGYNTPADLDALVTALQAIFAR